ncbi:MAG: riboflavin synthase [Bacteroidetes bacterium]|jgi:riboflavin synthase|nr:riboflavin synthase [Bacteroidota bacterium]MBT5530138.1 riboflavin synthase [Cytophagia bacterium]MBT3421371.1 riboflavin synthase [Bacteroidota bacterium]MBT3799853.1 riboflavin synthase [Bacteroidota bacterium]MBT3933571.1 riboflavin synthase [Bacteroidota bacterium]
MFSGIVEKLGKVVRLEYKGTNFQIRIETDIIGELHEDQSIAHNGVCMTIEKILEDSYQITAVEETMNKTSLGELKVGGMVNLERSLKMDSRFDGHIVQGHVDTTALCTDFKEADGSWYYTFQYKTGKNLLLVEKGSVTIDGVSLTAFNVNNKTGEFTVAIIPFTYDHTNFQIIRPGTKVNIEFDVLGKYIFAYMEAYKDAIK